MLYEMAGSCRVVVPDGVESKKNKGLGLSSLPVKQSWIVLPSNCSQVINCSLPEGVLGVIWVTQSTMQGMGSLNEK